VVVVVCFCVVGWSVCFVCVLVLCVCECVVRVSVCVYVLCV